MKSKESNRCKSLRPPISLVIFLVTAVSSVIVTYFAWSGAYFAGITSANVLGKAVIWSSLRDSDNNVQNQIAKVANLVSSASSDVSQGLLFNGTSRAEVQQNVRYAGRKIDLVNEGKQNPFVVYLQFLDFRCPTGKPPCLFWNSDGVHFLGFIGKFYPMVTTDPIPGNYCVNGAYFEHGNDWEINWNKTALVGTCVNSNAWPGVAVMYTESGFLWFGPYSPGYGQTDLQIAFVQAVRFNDSDRVVLVSAGFRLKQFSEELQSASSTNPASLQTSIIVDSKFQIIGLAPVSAPQPDEYVVHDRMEVDDIPDENLRTVLIAAKEKLLPSISAGTLTVHELFSLQGLHSLQFVGAQKLFLSKTYGPLSDWFIITVVPESAFLGIVYDARQNSIIIWAILSAVTVILSIIVSFIISRPIRNISKIMSFLKTMNTEKAEEVANSTRKYEFLVEVADLNQSTEAVIHNLVEYKKLQKQLVANKEDTLSRIAHASHEIRNPLSGILGMAEVGRGLVVAPSLDEYYGQMNTIHTVGHTLVRILNDMIDIGRLEQGKLQLYEQAIDIRQIIEDHGRLFKEKLDAKNIEFSYSVANNVGLFLVDPHRTSQILTNLLSNAIKFTNSGRITVKSNIQVNMPDTSQSQPAMMPRSNSIILEQSIAKQRVFIKTTVSDTGIGIKTHDLKRLFVVFSQIETDDPTEEEPVSREGSGLGLALTKRLVERMGGQVGVTSKVGEGSSFWFTLPYNEPTAVTPLYNPIASYSPRRSPNGSSDSVSSLQVGNRILVVDDNEVNRRVMQKLVEQHGFECETAINGVKCVEMMLENQALANKTNHYREEMKSEIPVLAVTGAIAADTERKCREAGFSGYISKPITRNAITDAFTEYCTTTALNPLLGERARVVELSEISVTTPFSFDKTDGGAGEKDGDDEILVL